jgi:competence protein ComEA
VGLNRRRLLAYAAVAVVAFAVGARYLLNQHGSAAASQGLVLAQLATSPTASALVGTGIATAVSPSASPSAAAEIVVDVCGAVVHPGVYHLPADARVCDLIAAAGGTTSRAQVAAVNLAARLVDGQQVVVPKRGESPAPGAFGGSSPGAGVGGLSASGASPVAAPVNLNTATLEQLDALPGVGPATAQKIIDYRTANGGFRSIEDLKNVSGIGDAKYEALKDLVTV